MSLWINGCRGNIRFSDPSRGTRHTGHCPHRTVIGIVDHDGAFADLVAVPEVNLHAVPDSIDDDTAVFTEPVAAAFQIPAQIRIARDDRIVVLGDGRLGNLCAQVLAGLSDRVVVVGKHPGKLAVLEAMGIDVRLRRQPGPSGFGETGASAEAGSHDAAHGYEEHSADIVVDCTGSAGGLTEALELVRPRGTIVLKTTVAGEQRLSVAPVVVDEVTVVGSRCGPFDRALDTLAHGAVDVGPLITDRFNLSDGVRALERAGERDALKALIETQ